MANQAGEQFLLYSELVKELDPGTPLKLEFVVLTKTKQPSVNLLLSVLSYQSYRFGLLVVLAYTRRRDCGPSLVSLGREKMKFLKFQPVRERLRNRFQNQSWELLKFGSGSCGTALKFQSLGLCPHNTRHTTDSILDDQHAACQIPRNSMTAGDSHALHGIPPKTVPRKVNFITAGEKSFWYTLGRHICDSQKLLHGLKTFHQKVIRMRFVTPLILFSLATTCLIADADASETVSREQPPNIVLLLADDLGWTGLGCFGSDFYETPHLDRLAATGTMFTNAYAACTVCSPTRASLMTGMYPARLHLTDFIAGQNRPYAKLKIPDWTKQLESRHVTVAEALREAGYTTAQIGKWHLARNASDSAEDPVAHGFDIQHMKPKGTKGYLLPKGFNLEGESKSDYLTDYLTDQALEVIDEHQHTPFFLYFAYHTPHTPIQGRADLVKKYQAQVRGDALHQNPDYAAMVHSLDQSVGRITARLQKNGLDRNTIVMFISDNGGLTQRNGKLDHFTDNAPLRRGKGSAFEGGVRVPAIMNWPGVTKPGSLCDEPIMTIDFYPTLLGLANASGDKTHNANLDGVSLMPLLKDSDSQLDRDLFWHYPHYHAGGDSPYSAIRSADWRLVHFHEDDTVRLFHLQEDLSEKTDLSAGMPEKTEELRKKLFAWRKNVDAQMPTSNPNYDPERASQTGVKKKPR